MISYYHTTHLDDDDETEITVEYTRTPFIPAKLYGPPEDCYPAEGGETEIVGISKIVDGREVSFEPTPEQLQTIYEELDQLPIEEDDSWVDYEIERRRDERMGI